MFSSVIRKKTYATLIFFRWSSRTLKFKLKTEHFLTYRNKETISWKWDKHFCSFAKGLRAIFNSVLCKEVLCVTLCQSSTYFFSYSYNGHPLDLKIVDVVDRWSLFRDLLCSRKKWDPKMMKVIRKRLLFRGGR